MRRTLIACACLLVAVASFAASPFYLDRCGMLWKGTSTDEGLLLTGEMDGEIQFSSLVPFVVGLNGNQDSQIQVAADELTGKVAVVWQRNYSAEFSEIYVAIWANGAWETITALTNDFAANPRFPLVKLSQVESEAPDLSRPKNQHATTLVRDSFLHIVWWQGSVESQHGAYALLRLTAEPDDSDALTVLSLDSLIPVGMGCDTLAPVEVLEHPLFATTTLRDRALIFFGSTRVCLFTLAEVSFELGPAEEAPNLDPSVGVKRRRHIPVFGVRQLYQVPEGFNMEGARLILGADLHPVAYRVASDKIEYVVASQSGWSPLRRLPVRNGLTLDQAIPLIENLAR